jgi:hypothetical protein
MDNYKYQSRKSHQDSYKAELSSVSQKPASVAQNRTNKYSGG